MIRCIILILLLQKHVLYLFFIFKGVFQFLCFNLPKAVLDSTVVDLTRQQKVAPEVDVRLPGLPGGHDPMNPIEKVEAYSPRVAQLVNRNI